MTIQEIKEKAEKLAVLRREITAQDEIYEQTVAPLKEEKERVQAELLKGLSEEGLASIKTENGESYIETVTEFISIRGAKEVKE